jgi:hypothetical protein
MVLGRFGEDIDAALALIDRALVLNPSFAYGWYWSGWMHLFAGQAELAIEDFETSMRLNPRGQRGFHLAGVGIAHFVSRRFEDAWARCGSPSKRFLRSHPHTGAGGLLRAYGPPPRSAIDPQEAGSTPVVVPTANPFRRPEDGELFPSGLRLAVGERE